MRDAFPPPIVVVEVVYVFRLGRLRMDGWFRLCGIARKWLFCLYGIVWKNITEMGRGGAYVPARMCGLFMGVGRGSACVPARVALQGRIRRSSPRAQCVYFWYGNAATRMFGRARRHRPYGFVWMDCTWTGIQVFVYPKSEKFHKKQRSASND